MKTGVQIREDVNKLSGDELVSYIIRLRNEAFEEGQAVCVEKESVEQGDPVCVQKETLKTIRAGLNHLCSNLQQMAKDPAITECPAFKKGRGCVLLIEKLLQPDSNLSA